MDSTNESCTNSSSFHSVFKLKVMKKFINCFFPEYNNFIDVAIYLLNSGQKIFNLVSTIKVICLSQYQQSYQVYQFILE
ncbi:unnamed protein product [Paramecium sonneborni]|uniref:Uncharacterized protein n=1 Tax=Paramecium sonneborni TaxID=65129 RepID=A0A8S1NFY3_9CILI|nr:unnamed protein product [Paramecium sonneborni]